MPIDLTELKQALNTLANTEPENLRTFLAKALEVDSGDDLKDVIADSNQSTLVNKLEIRLNGARSYGNTQRTTLTDQIAALEVQYLNPVRNDLSDMQTRHSAVEQYLQTLIDNAVAGQPVPLPTPQEIQAWMDGTTPLP